MAGAVIENLSTKKLVGILLVLLLAEVVFILVGGLVASQPTHTLGPVTLHHCRRNHRDPNQLILPKKCREVDIEFTKDKMTEVNHKSDPNEVVFTNIIPHQRNIWMSRWFQYLLCFVSPRIKFQSENQMRKDAVMTLDVRIAYSDHDEPWLHEEAWTLFANSTEERKLDCQLNHNLPHNKTEELENFEYDCDPMFLFQLGSLPHKRYLINMILPVHVKESNFKVDPKHNQDIGNVAGMDIVAVMQTGGFTTVWLTMKTALFTIMIFPVVWFWRRVSALARKSMLIERACFVLGITMVFLNFPVEFFTIIFDAPWMLLFTDIRQGFFYAILLSFWVIFTGEHLMDQAHRNKLSAYKWHLGSIFAASCALLAFDLAERGMQLVNPFNTIWQHPGFGYALLIIGGISAAVYLTLLLYLVYKVFHSISYKRRFILPEARALQFESIVSRLKRLMLLTVATAGLTVIFYFLEQKLDGVLNEWYALDVQVASAFFTGVYGLWNIYVFIILSMYAPSHKTYLYDAGDGNSEEHELNALQNNSEQTQILQLAQQKDRED